ncbi:MAG TPA: DUF3048 domain-containing protein [Anaerolineales bacterium]|nr:DUF3048 domain-containing protein [Anaerolineales bacterium]
MHYWFIRISIVGLIAALLLSGCSALPVFYGLAPPQPTFPPPADIDATVRAISTATASAWTPTPFGTPAPGQPTATEQPTRTPTFTPSPTPTLAALPYTLPVNTGPFTFPNNVNPLTGLTVADPGILDRRPLAVKITNYPRYVRPQSGLTVADLVFEYYIEGGLTRFIAVFYGKDADRIGPVRSGRFFDEHIVRIYNAIFAFASADRRVLDLWLNSDLLPRLVLPRTDNCPPLCRDLNNTDYNNLFTNSAQLALYSIAQGGDNDRYELPGMRFQTLVPWGGEPAEKTFTRYSWLDYNYWLFNPGTGLYERYADTVNDTGQGEQYAALYDTYTGLPVSAANVVYLFVPHEKFLESSDTEIVTINLQGAGAAYIFRDGQVYEASWARTDLTAPLQLFRAGRGAGTHFPLKPGLTFFQVIGVTSTVEKGEDSWRFLFAIP